MGRLEDEDALEEGEEISTQEEVVEDQVGGARWEEDSEVEVEVDVDGTLEDEDMDMVELRLGGCSVVDSGRERRESDACEAGGDGGAGTGAGGKDNS